jgi:hypothetical protein
MPISIQEQEKSNRFMSAINKVLEIIDELTNVIPEGKYLEICNNLKVLNDNKGIIEIIQELHDDPVFRQHRARADMVLIRPTPIKKKNICVYCDTEVLNISNHQTRNKCKMIRKTKRLSALSGKEVTNNIHFMTENIKRFVSKVYCNNMIRQWKNNVI